MPGPRPRGPKPLRQRSRLHRFQSRFAYWVADRDQLLHQPPKSLAFIDLGLGLLGGIDRCGPALGLVSILDVPGNGTELPSLTSRTS